MPVTVLEDNQITIENYLKAYENEVNAAKNTRKSPKYILSALSKFHNHKLFTSMMAEDIQNYLSSLKKPVSEDPMHKSIGTYNTYSVHLVRFFKWLYYPEHPVNERPKPKCVMNVKIIPRREKSIYKASDMWTQEDDLLFLRYCPSKRMKAYHMLARDSSARPHEILQLKVKELVYKSVDGKQYAEILVNGKTGTRHIPLIASVPYIREYLMSEHPMPTNPNAALISGVGKSFGKHLLVGVVDAIYREFKNKYFPKLLEIPNVSQDDKNAITELLKKPFNPYIRRLTDKSKFLKESVLKQHAGWVSLSNCPSIYLHYFGNESSESILEAYGLKPSAQTIDKLKPKQCPNCDEGNRTDARYCIKCKMILSYDGYSQIQETIEEKSSKLDELQETMNKLMQTLVKQGVLKPIRKED